MHNYASSKILSMLLATLITVFYEFQVTLNSVSIKLLGISWCSRQGCKPYYSYL